MSKYSERHRSSPQCAVPNCGETASKLARVADKPVWLCEAHANAATGGE